MITAIGLELFPILEYIKVRKFRGEKMLELKINGGIITITPNKYLLFEDLETEKSNEKIFESHKRYLLAILSKDGRKIKVNWFEYASIVKNADYQIRHDIERYINLILISLNVLTENPEKAWTFSDQGMNPEWGVSSAELFNTVFLGRAYFVNKDDIIDYANANWKDRTSWSIFQMKNVLNKEEVC